MLRLNILLGIILLGSVAFGQTAEIENGEGGESVRTKLNEDINKGNDHADTIPELRIDINKNVDTLGVHLDTLQSIRTDVNSNTDSLAVHLDTLQAIRVNVNGNADSLAIHLDTIQALRVDVNSNADSIAVHLDSLQALRVDVNSNVDSLGVHLDTLQSIRVDVNSNADSLAIHLDTLQAVRVDVNSNVDSLAIHLDTIQTIRSDLNAEITLSADTAAAQRGDINNITGLNDITSLDTASSVGAADLMGIVQSGTPKSTSKVVLQSELNDFISSLNQTITAIGQDLDLLKTNVYFDSTRVNETADTIFWYKGGEVLQAFAIPSIVVITDVLPPVITSASTPSATTIKLFYNEPLSPDSVPTIAAYTLTEDGVEFGLAGVSVADDSVTITLDSTIEIGAALLIDYVVPGSLLLQDTSFNTAIALNNYIVLNTITPSQTAYAQYYYEDDSTDEMDAWDLTITNELFDNVVFKQGAVSHYYSNTTRWGTASGSFDVDTVWSTAFWFYSSNSTSKNFMNNQGGGTDGYKINWDVGSDEYSLTTGNGATSTVATSLPGYYSQSTFIHLAFVVDGDTVTIYVNGVDRTDDVGAQTDYATTGLEIGRSAYSRMDDHQFYKFALTSAEVGTIYNNPGSRIVRYGDEEEEQDDSDITSVLSIDFESTPIGAEVDGFPAGYTRIQADSDFGSGGSWGPGRYPNPNGDYNYIGSGGITSSYKSTGRSLYTFIRQGVYQVGIAGLVTIPEADEYYQEFNLMIRPGFTPTDFGKILGLAGTGTGSLSTSVPSGAQTPIDVREGFSLRHSWSRTTNAVRNGISAYLYHHDRVNLKGNTILAGEQQFCVTDPINSQQSGEVVPDFSERLQAWNGTDSVYINIICRVVMNTIANPGVGNYDGILEYFIDGDLKFQRTNLRFRNYADIHINKIYVDIYSGGSGAGAIPTRNEWLVVDDINVYTLDDPPVEGNNASSIGRVMVPQVTK